MLVTAAGVDDGAAAPTSMGRLDPVVQPRLEPVRADGEYHNLDLYEWLGSKDCPLAVYVEIVRRPEGAKGFVPLPRRWVVERTLAWLGRYRRHGRDHERKPSGSEALVNLSMMNLMLHRLAPDDRYPPFHYRLAA